MKNTLHLKDLSLKFRVKIYRVGILKYDVTTLSKGQNQYQDSIFSLGVVYIVYNIQSWN